nr:hypothetical protein [Tanacetum cinerariifolium]
NQGIQNVGNQNRLSDVPGIAIQHGNGNVVAARVKGNSNAINGNPIRLLKRKKHGFDSLMRNLISWLLQSDKAPVYDLDGSTKIHISKNCYDNDIFNMFTQEEQYNELLKPISEPHQVPQNDSNVIYEVSSMEQGRGIVEQRSATIEETRVYHDSLFYNLAAEVEKVNSVNHKMKETNVELTTELARYKNQEKCFEFSQEKYDKLERCYQKSVYQEQCLTKKINALHLSSDEISPIVNQVDARVQNFEIQFLKEVAKFVRDLKSLAKEADESLVKHKALELEIKRLLRAVVSQDIMSVVQNNSVVDISNL